MKKMIVSITVLLLFVSITPSRAGGPYYIDDSGFYKWENGVINVWLDKDLDENSTDANAKDVRRWLTCNIMDNIMDTSDCSKTKKGAFDIWNSANLKSAKDVGEEIRVAGARFHVKGTLDKDINETNYGPYFLRDKGANNPARKTVIIYDSNGGIFNKLAALWKIDNLVDTVLGITDIFAVNKETRTIINGTIILNGQWLKENGRDPGKVAQFRVAILHELGHLLNLDHSTVNEDCYSDRACGKDWEQFMPTMFHEPQASVAQLTLHPDDVAWSAALYAKENTAIFDEFCKVKGKIVDKKGRGFQGAEVVATEIGNSAEIGRINRITAVTGAFSAPCREGGEFSTDGSYVIPGLRPNKTYRIEYQRIPSWCDNSCDKGTDYCTGVCGLANGVNPFAPPRNLDAKGIITFGGSETVKCEIGADGKAKLLLADLEKLDNVDLDDEYYYRFMEYYTPPGFPSNVECKKVAPPPDDDKTRSPSGLLIDKKGWCSLAGGGGGVLGALAFFLPTVFILFKRRRSIKI